MGRLIPVRLPVIEAAAAIRASRDSGDAVLVLDPGAPQPEVEGILARMRPDLGVEPEVAAVVVASGTAGAPKGVELTRDGLAASGEAVGAALEGRAPGPHRPSPRRSARHPPLRSRGVGPGPDGPSHDDWTLPPPYGVAARRTASWRRPGPVPLPVVEPTRRPAVVLDGEAALRPRPDVVDLTLLGHFVAVGVEALPVP